MDNIFIEGFMKPGGSCAPDETHKCFEHKAPEFSVCDCKTVAAAGLL